jgi:hypothetical protein
MTRVGERADVVAIGAIAIGLAAYYSAVASGVTRPGLPSTTRRCARALPPASS